jgi:hypothetical protein
VKKVFSVELALLEVLQSQSVSTYLFYTIALELTLENVCLLQWRLSQQRGE